MDVRIGTLTSRVTVADGGAATPALIDAIVELVLRRIREERASHESAQREQEVRQQMSDPEPFERSPR